jgi:uncharacterized zinc-type alcohol dehydrogenase-like protein
MRSTTGWAAAGPNIPLAPWLFERRDLRPGDVAVRVRHVGVCGTDLDALRPGADGDVGLFPLVAGHEIAGEVAAIGAEVTRFKIGDAVCIGNIVDSCGVCRACLTGDQEFCREFPTLTYAGRDRVDGSLTQGGFSNEYVADETFVHAQPANLDPAETAPLLCAGITTWVPLRTWGVGPGQSVGVIGLGGLGHLAVKFAKALGAEVVQFTTTPGKVDAARELGADDVVVSSDTEAMASQRERFDFILDTVPRPHDLSPYLSALKFDRTLCSLGIQSEMPFSPQALRFGRKRLAGAGSGGVAATREMLEFCADHDLAATIERLPIERVDEALDRLAANDVHYRFVLDL